jgi:hypothetical protein
MTTWKVRCIVRAFHHDYDTEAIAGSTSYFEECQ